MNTQLFLVVASYSFGALLLLGAFVLPADVRERLGNGMPDLPFLLAGPMTAGFGALLLTSLASGPLLLLGGQTSVGLAMLGAGVLVGFGVFWWVRDEFVQEMGVLRMLIFTLLVSMMLPFIAVCTLFSRAG